MSLKKQVLACTWIVLLAFGVSRAETVDKLPKPTSYVSDFAGVIDDGSKQSLEDLSRQIYEKAHATIEVVTIHSLEGGPIEDFTTALEDKWQVGAKGTDKGVLMVFAIDDHKRRIEVGRGLEGILNDAKVGDIGRAMVPQLKEGAYGPAMLLGVQQLGNVIAADAGVTLDAPSVPAHTYHRERVSNGGGGFRWIGIALFILFILLMSRGGRGGGGGIFWFLLGNVLGGSGRSRGGWGGGGGGGWGGGGGDSGGGGDFGGGFGGGSDGGGASGDW